MTELSAISGATAGHRPSSHAPTRLSALLFALKSSLFRFRRSLQDRGTHLPGLVNANALFPCVVAESRSDLWSDTRVAERAMQLGKVQNLRVAARRLDGLLIPAQATFSFWRQLGKPVRRRGFVDGRMLQEGCMVRSVGGGLCQLSNALYDAALQAGCEIVERHPHSRIVPGSAALQDRDATIAWNYVDLRFRNARDLQLRVRLTEDALVVQLLGLTPERARMDTKTLPDPRPPAESCSTCEETSCFRHESARTPGHARTAFLLDDAWPEFTAFVAAQKKPSDILGIPLDGARWSIARYRWNTEGFARIGTATMQTLLRGLSSRRVAAQGAVRQTAQLRSAEALAKRYARLLTPEITDVCVAQPFLPFLWRDGHLAARRVTVLMSRLPIRELQAKLDRHAARHPERPTLTDFRAPGDVAEWESCALAAAERIVAPHSEIAHLFGERALKLEWVKPPASRISRTASHRVAFPGPTVARKGCYELHEAARALDIEIVPLGSEIEAENFWSGVRISKPSPGHWLDGIAAVVQPAIVEQAPRRLLTALASGVSVVATKACGLDPQLGLTLVPEGDADALADAIRRVLG
jgi:hypothetical protein